MEKSYRSEGFLGEFCENNEGWSQPSYNTTDLAYLPYTVAEQNNFYNSNVQQNQNIGNWGFNHCLSETFSHGEQFGIQDTYVFHDDFVEIAKLQLKRERNRIASNKCR